MIKYVVDANLPYHFSLWGSTDFIHVFDIDYKMSDQKIWEYAIENNLTIISKDSDFSQRILLQSPPPRVIHLKIGNLKLKDLYQLLFLNWEQILTLSEQHKLVNVYKDKIEAIN
jgi:predicted nuclease of predicted toxin-antitoxin system